MSQNSGAVYAPCKYPTGQHFCSSYERHFELSAGSRLFAAVFWDKTKQILTNLAFTHFFNGVLIEIL